MPKKDRQALRLKHMSTGGNLNAGTKVKATAIPRKRGR